MKYRYDGSVQASATPTYQNAGRKEDYATYRCVVTKVLYVDDANNITINSTNPRVLYDVVVLGGYAAGQVISNCRLASDLGGESGFYERVLRASTSDVSVSRLSDSDGDIVLVQFVQGHTSYPMIVALDNGIHTSDKIGAKLAQGPRLLREYNGIRETINNDGEWKHEVKGGTAVKEKGNFKAAPIPLVTREIKKEETMTTTFKSGIKFHVDGPKDRATATFKNGIVLDIDGILDKVNLTTKEGCIVDVDGKNAKITLTYKETIIELDGKTEKISLKGKYVDLGAAVSDFAVLFNELLNTFNSHTHNYIAPAHPAGSTPTTPPTAPMMQSVGSQTVKVQP